MSTRFRKLRTRKHKSRGLKTRKHRGGNSLLERLGFGKKSPHSTEPTNSNPLNRIPTAGRTMSINAFKKGRLLNQKQKEFAKVLRNHMTRIKSINEETRKESLNLMNVNTRQKMQTLLDYPDLNSLSDMQLVELYKTGKVRSKSI
jgi:hypothetical protein